ncbi:hypothetical protein IT568_02065 [bacterium]|nr:hypothetical protein [bacterium]
MQKIFFLILFFTVVACSSTKKVAQTETINFTQNDSTELVKTLANDSTATNQKSISGTIWEHSFGYLFKGLGYVLGYFWDKTESLRSYYNTLFNAKKLFEKTERTYLERLKTEAFGTSSMAQNTSRLKSDLNANEKKDFDLVIEKCSKLLELYPNSKHKDNAIFLIGKSFYYKWEFEKSTQKFDELRSNFPKSKFCEDALLWKGKSLYKRRFSEPLETDKIKFTSQAEEILSNVIIESKKKYVVGDAYQTLGEIAVLRLDLEKAIVNFNKSIEFIKDKQIKINVHFKIGDALLELGKNDEALAEYTKIEKLSPGIEDEFEKNYKKGKALRLSGKIDEAKKIFVELLKLKEESFGEEKLFAVTAILFNVNTILDQPRQRDEVLDENGDIVGDGGKRDEEIKFETQNPVDNVEKIIPSRVWYSKIRASLHVLKDSTLYTIPISKRNANQNETTLIEEPVTLNSSVNSEVISFSIPLETTEKYFWAIVFDKNKPKLATFNLQNARLEKLHPLPADYSVTPQSFGDLTFGNNWLWYLTPEKDIFRINPETGLSEPSPLYRLLQLSDSYFSENITFTANFLWTVAKTRKGTGLLKINPASGEIIQFFALPNALKNLNKKISLASSVNNEFFLTDYTKNYTYRLTLEKDVSNVNLAQRNLKEKFPQVSFELSEVLLQQNNYPTALGELQEVIYSYPNSVHSTKAYFKLGSINENLFFDFPQALENYSKISGQQNFPNFSKPALAKQKLLEKFLLLSKKNTQTKIQFDSLWTDSLNFALQVDSLVKNFQLSFEEASSQIKKQKTAKTDTTKTDSLSLQDSTSFALTDTLDFHEENLQADTTKRLMTEQELQILVFAVKPEKTLLDSLAKIPLTNYEINLLITEEVEPSSILKDKTSSTEEKETVPVTPQVSLEDENFELTVMILKGWDLRKIRSNEKNKIFKRIEFVQEPETENLETAEEEVLTDSTNQQTNQQISQQTTTQTNTQNESFFAKINKKREQLALDNFALGEYLFIDFAKYDSARTSYKQVLEITKDSTLVAKTLYSLRALELVTDSLSLVADSLGKLLTENFADTIYGKEILIGQGKLKREKNFLKEEKTDSVLVLFHEAEDFLWEKEDFKEAITKFDQIVKTYPENQLAPKSQLAIAWTYEKKIQDFSKALAEYKELKENFKNTPYAQIATDKLKEPPKEVSKDSLKTTFSDSIAVSDSLQTQNLTNTEKKIDGVTFVEIETKPTVKNYETLLFNNAFNKAFMDLAGKRIEQKRTITDSKATLIFSISTEGKVEDLQIFNVSPETQALIETNVLKMDFNPGIHEVKIVKTVNIPVELSFEELK